MAQALLMGDEVHNRNAAASGLLLRRLCCFFIFIFGLRRCDLRVSRFGDQL